MEGETPNAGSESKEEITETTPKSTETPVEASTESSSRDRTREPSRYPQRQQRFQRQPGGPRRFFRKRYCTFCAQDARDIDYKDGRFLRRFVTDRGKMLPRRITGVCAYHQRKLSPAIKRARILALLPIKGE